MKPRKSSIKDKCIENKVKAWKILMKKAFGPQQDVLALRAIIELAEQEDNLSSESDQITQNEGE